jgi:hypothetical protein
MDTAFFSEINWLAVLVAAVAYFMLGALWYSVLFGKKWIAYQNIDMSHPDARKGTGVIMTGSFVLMLLATFALAVLVIRLDLTVALSGIKLGLFTGFFFSMTAISITYLYIKKPSGLHFIDGLYHVTGQALAAMILCLWR